MKLGRDVLRKLPLALRIEIEENARRKGLTQSELAAQQKRILDELRKYKAPGKRTDLDGTSASGEAEVRLTGIVGKIFNEGHAVVEKRLAIVAAAEAEPEKFGKLAAEMDRTGKVNSAYRQLNATRDEERILGFAPVADKFRTLTIDPPWDYEGLSVGGDSAPGYATMTHEQLLALHVGSWAEEDCHLYLWTTNNFSGRAHELMSHWGFDFKTMLTWVKPRRGWVPTFAIKPSMCCSGFAATCRRDRQRQASRPISKPRWASIRRSQSASTRSCAPRPIRRTAKRSSAKRGLTSRICSPMSVTVSHPQSNKKFLQTARQMESKMNIEPAGILGAEHIAQWLKREIQADLAHTGRDVAGARDRERNDLPYWAARRGGEMVAFGVLAADAAVTELAEAETRAGLSCLEAERTAWSRIRATGGFAHA